VKIEILLDKLGAPARRAIEGLGVKKVEDLARYSDEAIGALHGVGPSAMATIRAELSGLGRSLGSSRSSAVDAYIAAFPAATRERLQAIRRTIQAAAPEATEKMAYGIPTFVWNGNLVHFAGYPRHVGFYPGATGVAAFERELAPYRHAKGSIQFPLDGPLPLGLVERVVRHRLAENLRRRPGR